MFPLIRRRFSLFAANTDLARGGLVVWHKEPAGTTTDSDESWRFDDLNRADPYASTHPGGVVGAAEDQLVNHQQRPMNIR